MDELAAAETYAAAAGLAFDSTPVQEGRPLFYVTFYNRDGESFLAEIDCRDYPMFPPVVEFLDEARMRRATRDLYPSCFHGMPCVCARYNRKAYSQYGGPHGDWRLVDWQMPTSNAGEVAVKTLALIVSDLHSKIAVSKGRLG
jgi:hypothetical protein